MGNFDGIWEHELVWLAFLQKENAASETEVTQEHYSQQLEKSLEYLKHLVFQEDLSWDYKDGVLICTSKHDEAGRLNYLNAVLSAFKR